MEFILNTKDLKKYYKKFKALDGLTINVPKGSIYGLIGRNGAGKTTLIRIVCGMQYSDGGEFSLYGVSSSDKNISASRRRIGSVIETPALYYDMTAEDNLKQQYLILGMPDYSGTTELLELVGLKNTGSKKVRQFSLGMRQRLGIAVALCGSPDLLVLDEPINGLDPEGIIEIRELILKLNREKNITVLISSHYLDELSKIATHYGFINEGKTVREMSAEELEAACRKCISVKVSDTAALARVLEKMDLSYQINDGSNAYIYAKPSVTQLALALSEENCELISVEEHDESLESFYISMIGGGDNE